MTDEGLKEELEKLRKENEQLKRKIPTTLTFKVSEKGAVSLYGIGRFPVTLYKEQWRKIIGNVNELENFIKENEHLLKAKE